MDRRLVVGLCALLLGLQVPLGSHAQAVPALTSAITVDADGDGRIDAVILDFDARISERNLKLSEFSVQGHPIIGYRMPSDSDLHLLLQEAPGFDSGATPSVKYSVVGSGGQKASGSVTAEDRAAPVLVSVLAVAGDDDVRLRWSEAVQGVSDPIAANEVAYTDRSGNGAGSVVEVAQDGTDTIATLNAAVTAQDLAEDILAPGAAVKDAAGNPARPSARALTGPRIVAAVADVGSDEVRVFFNVPLAGVPGDGSFDVVYDQPPSDPIAGVTSVRTGGSPDEVLVTLTDKVKASDVRSLEPAFLSSSPEKFSAKGIHGGETIAFQPSRAPLVDNTAPRVVGVQTQDRNRNGLLDAVLVTLSEPAVSTCVHGTTNNVEGPSGGIRVTLYQDGSTIPYVLDHATGQVPKAVDAEGKVLLVRLQERTSQASDTGLIPELTVGPCGNGDMPFQDLAETQRGGTVGGNFVLPVGLASVAESDGASPVVQRATSQDRDQDGLLDAYVLQFSEPLVQTAFKAEQWTVVDHTIAGGIWDAPDTLILELEERPDGSSSDLPKISYTGGGAEDLRDPSGNPLERFDGGNFDYVDDAGPRILRVYGDVGQKRLRIEFSEPVEGVDPDSGGPGRNLQESDFFYQDAGGGVAGITAVQHTRGERTAFLVLNAPLGTMDLSDDATGGDAVLAVQGRIREANADAAKDRAPVSGEPVHLLRLDVDAPGIPGSLDEDGIETDTTVTTAALTFSAPSDDAGLPDTGAVKAYRVFVSNKTIPDPETPEDIEALRASGAWATVTLPRAAPGEPGFKEVVTVGGLCPSTTYSLGIEAVDDFDNPSGLAILRDLVTLDDESPAMGGEAVRMRSTTHPLDKDGVVLESTKLAGAVTLEGFTDPEACGLEYVWIVDGDDNTLVDAANATAARAVPEGGGGNGTFYRATEPAVRFDLHNATRPVDLWLHVAAQSPGGLSDTYHYPLRLVLPVPCTVENLLMPDIESVRERGSTTVTWGDYRNDLPDGIELVGYQVWMRPAKGSQLLREELEPPSEGFEERRFLDDLKLRKGDSYLVTAYFTDDLCRFAWDESALLDGSDPGGPNGTFGVARTSLISDPPAVPVWAWVTLAVVAMLVVGGLVLFFNLRHQRLDESWLHEDEDPHDPDNPFGSDPLATLDGDDGADAFGADDTVVDPFGGGGTAAAGAASSPMLDITCPACTHRFQAQGARPLHIVCPNCSASGTLE